LNTRTILLIDDDADDRELFMDAVSEIQDDLLCITAEDGEEALNLLMNPETLLPDIVFIDLNMPRYNGIRCIQEIKKIPRLLDLPIVIYTTTASIQQQDEIRKLGVSHFLTKPMMFKDICELIKSIMVEVDSGAFR
jgi:CheY-like chemotaxis protein